MTVAIRVVPNAKKTFLKEEHGNVKLYITKPALEGKANKEVVAVMAKLLGLRKGDVAIVKGEKSREKVLSLPLDKEAYAKRIADALAR